MPKGKKRLKIAALEMLPVNPSVFVPNVNMEEEEKKTELDKKDELDAVHQKAKLPLP